ncbi:gliding motility-associated C-terminal domain-containing protein [Muriicola jejuensis]|uniref:T9SS type B sorting domain-containing protein n=1 Tax=Muriicola jejuensis TaxID=504488 RepID=A0A6P0U9V5_9FLAO|nr:gliding motility-associated C-terminal domain-containing protein [Muriicola jejuensis]NER09290.1 T9SS type B sorting domain-containing protein [Muriicola jejuensis]SMP09740.1 gliding motility-associated C-terminal domain-containing protein [Muriicola jejuensis]
MNYRLIILALLFFGNIRAQDSVHNFGAIQIHNNAEVGFHLDLVNDGSFEQTTGLVGFYGNDVPLTISGAFAPTLYDTEIDVPAGLNLQTTVNVNNNVNLVTGDIRTAKSGTAVYSNFLDDAFYIGESSASKIDGYGGMTNKSTFVFPVGNEERLRPLTIESVAINAMAKCAYFFEDPNDSKTLNQSFLTNRKATDFISVSDREFWRLESDVPSRVTLTWDMHSNVRSLGEYLSDIKVVGWSKAENQWVNLGNSAVEGGMAYGSVTSEEFVPSDYEILTLGGNDDRLETYDTVDLDNYFMTPNGDGTNDMLELEGIAESPNNLLEIFDRYGVLVYSKANYRNDFNGQSNRESAIQRGRGLASGIYFYILTMHDLRQKHQGYLYISN